jgi:ectoine hydroxylase-related dioxygenase (phytanoyl-CoA dioxygenase family)
MFVEDGRVIDRDVEAYERDGAVCVRGVVTTEELASLRAGIETNLADLSPLAQVASKPNDPGRFVEDFCNWQRIAQYETFFRTSQVTTVAKMLMRTQSIRTYHDHLLVKEAGTTQPTPWHQDQPYYNVSGRQIISAWVPVDPVPRESTLEFVVGSHQGEWLMPRTFLHREAKWFPEGTLQEIPDDPQPVVGWALEPGDVVFFHALTLHRSAGASTRRRVVSFRYLGDDARHAPRRWRTSPPFEGLTEQLPENAPMNHPLFPLIN